MRWPAGISIIVVLGLAALAFAQAAGAPGDSKEQNSGPSTKPIEPTRENYLLISSQVEKSLHEDDLAKFFPAAVDPAGGFFENFAEDWTHVDGTSGRGGPDTTRSIVYQSRLTWLAAQAAMRYPDQADIYLKYARHGAEFLATKQWDQTGGGFWWSVDVNGKPIRADDKHIYGNAFAIYALAAAYQATHDQADLDLAKKAFAWIDAHAHDDVRGGYFEQLHADGSHTPAPAAGAAPARGGGDVLGAKPGQKTMNSHIHLLEALTGLLEVWPDDLVKKRTEEVYQIGLTKIYAEPGYLHQFFAEDWTPAVSNDSYGHDIECAYLFTEAAAALGKPDDPAAWDAGKKIVDHCLAVGYDPTSGSLNSSGTVDGTGTPDKSRVWWVQAESANALLLMHERFGKNDPKYWNAFVREWDFINTYQIDHKNGGWYNTINAQNMPRARMPKTDAWTEGYHQGRAMLNITARLKQLAAGN